MFGCGGGHGVFGKGGVVRWRCAQKPAGLPRLGVADLMQKRRLVDCSHLLLLNCLITLTQNRPCIYAAIAVAMLEPQLFLYTIPVIFVGRLHTSETLVSNDGHSSVLLVQCIANKAQCTGLVSSHNQVSAGRAVASGGRLRVVVATGRRCAATLSAIGPIAVAWPWRAAGSELVGGRPGETGDRTPLAAAASCFWVPF